MINNNRQQQNGRRRGRGGQRPGGNGGGQGGRDTGNRIDSRARGNAAQLLEKYKSLARDAQMHGDRVNTEYYLQFADHYFRVVSEQRGRFEDQHQPRGGGANTFDEDDYDGDDVELRGDGPTQAPAQPTPPRENRDGRDGNRTGGNRERMNGDARGRDGGSEPNDGEREPARDEVRPTRDAPRRSEQDARAEQAPRRERPARDDAPVALPTGASFASEGEPATATPRPRRARTPRRDDAPDAGGDTFDVDRLPPSFVSASPAADDATVADADGPVVAEKPRRRRLRPATEEQAD